MQKSTPKPSINLGLFLETEKKFNSRYKIMNVEERTAIGMINLSQITILVPGNVPGEPGTEVKSEGYLRLTVSGHAVLKFGTEHLDMVADTEDFTMFVRETFAVYFNYKMGKIGGGKLEDVSNDKSFHSRNETAPAVSLITTKAGGKTKFKQLTRQRHPETFPQYQSEYKDDFGLIHTGDNVETEKERFEKRKKKPTNEPT